jgi:hypothetical protein
LSSSGTSKRGGGCCRSTRASTSYINDGMPSLSASVRGGRWRQASLSPLAPTSITSSSTQQRSSPPPPPSWLGGSNDWCVGSSS